MAIILELCPFDQFISNRERAKSLTLNDVNVAGVLLFLRFAGENAVLLYPFLMAAERVQEKKVQNNDIKYRNAAQ